MNARLSTFIRTLFYSSICTCNRPVDCSGILTGFEILAHDVDHLLLRPHHASLQCTILSILSIWSTTESQRKESQEEKRGSGRQMPPLPLVIGGGANRGRNFGQRHVELHNFEGQPLFPKLSSYSNNQRVLGTAMVCGVIGSPFSFCLQRFLSSIHQWHLNLHLEEEKIISDLVAKEKGHF